MPKRHEHYTKGLIQCGDLPSLNGLWVKPLPCTGWLCSAEVYQPVPQGKQAAKDQISDGTLLSNHGPALPLGLTWPLPVELAFCEGMWKMNQKLMLRDKCWSSSAYFADLEQPRGILACVLPAGAELCCWLEWAQCCLLFHWTYLCFSLFSLFEDWVWYTVCA